MKHLLLTIILSFTTFLIFAQNEQDRKFIINQTNTEALKEIIIKHERNKEKWKNDSSKTKIEPVLKNKTGKVIYFSGYDEKGNPVYDYDDNINAAATSKVNAIWLGGSLGLDLTGDGVVIGHWEASGAALQNHQELVGKITLAENIDVSDHATHTATTMVGSGVVGNARGMASGATIISRKSDSDEYELAEFALTGGILSNHSYSTGDPEGNIPLYGQYTYNAYEWDDIMYNAPYLFICKSAGNNRNDPTPNPLDNGYDIIYTISGCKNLITVGAIADLVNYSGPLSVTQSTFSNWGPTDDWRVKPDITTNGVGLYSALGTGTTNYGSMSGTSMSAPTLAGSVALLQQHYKNKNAVYMKAATVKALLLGTTDEVGEFDGPDFQSGWGLLNAERAAKTISNNGISSIIEEIRLNNKNSFVKNVVSNGIDPVTLTIVWTDPAGTPVTGEDNLTPILVNDLDVRIKSKDSTYLPWVMVPNESKNNFTDPALRGDNFRDNIEKIEANLPAGIYTLIVSHKGSLTGSYQDFSLVATSLTEGPPVTKFDLTTFADAEKGSITKTPVNETYDSLSVVSIEAKPLSGWEFESWSGDLSGSVNPTSLVMDKNKTITANFKELPNVIPQANTNGNYSGFINTEISFINKSTDPDGNITSYNWNFGDGSSSNLENPTHTYASIDTFKVILTVTDNIGASDSDTCKVFVLDPGSYAKLPYSTGFEDGAFDKYWVAQSDNQNGRIRITSENTPKSGNYQLAMDVYTSGTYATNSACLKLNLKAENSAYLSFWWKELDEPHTSDGIFLSDNAGISYTKVYELTSESPNFKQINLNLIQLATEKNLNLSGPFIVKFQQYDDYPFPYNGFYFDDISVSIASSIDDIKNQDPGKEKNFKLYPNPANENITIEFANAPKDAVAIKFYNIVGSLVKEIKANAKTNIIDLSTFENGIYFAKIENNKEIYTQKVIVAKKK